MTGRAVWKVAAISVSVLFLSLSGCASDGSDDDDRDRRNDIKWNVRIDI